MTIICIIATFKKGIIKEMFDEQFYIWGTILMCSIGIDISSYNIFTM